MSFRNGPIGAALMTVLIVLSVGATFAEGGGREECEGPTGKAEVRVVKTSEAPPMYEFILTNKHSSPILLFSIGTGAVRKMDIIPENIPSRVMAPDGWRGTSAFGHESSYMHIQWSPKEVKNNVPPNATLRGFIVEMPTKTNESKAPSSGVKPTKPLDLTQAPYRVWFLDRSCSWGFVEHGKAELSGNG